MDKFAMSCGDFYLVLERIRWKNVKCMELHRLQRLIWSPKVIYARWIWCYDGTQVIVIELTVVRDYDRL